MNDVKQMRKSENDLKYYMMLCLLLMLECINTKVMTLRSCFGLPRAVIVRNLHIFSEFT